ncbi:MAG: alpha-galactosidase [Planctomycetes bacterium]|nr:alpha-galactosidase [Planctomycetota bacterium]
MAKIVIIGAGSQFGSRLSLDILAREELRGTDIALVDINAKRLAQVSDFVQQAIDNHQLPSKVVATTDRTEVMRGADVVITSISVGGYAYSGFPWSAEINIPLKYGVSQCVADTVGPGGVFRFLRTAPIQRAICEDIKRLCPDAWLLNYTNPMCMLTWMHSDTGVTNVGLCHSVQGTTHEIARHVGVPGDEVDALVAGINHQAWFLKVERKGQDLYPALRAAAADPAKRAKDAVRFEMMEHLGYFVTESSHHNSEYAAWFRKDAETMQRLGLEKREVKEGGPEPEWRRPGTPGEAPKLVRSNEYAADIVAAKLVGKTLRFNGNVMNRGLIPNLPEGSCVEVPCLVDRLGIHPVAVGPLPPQLAALNRSNIAVQELAVLAARSHSREAAYHAVLHDPLTSAVLPLPKIRAMFDEMWTAEKDLLAWMETPAARAAAGGGG